MPQSVVVSESEYTRLVKFGRVFFGTLSQSISASGDYDIGITVPASVNDRFLRLVSVASTVGTSYISIYQGITSYTGGTALSMPNQNNKIATTPSIEIKYGVTPTLGASYKTVDNHYFAVAGQMTPVENMQLLLPSGVYDIRMHNGSGGTGVLSVAIQLIE